jgi:hypothetical protein
MWAIEISISTTDVNPNPSYQFWDIVEIDRRCSSPHVIRIQFVESPFLAISTLFNHVYKGDLAR